MICIKNGWVHDAVHEEPYIADVLADKGKITAIGKNLIVPHSGGCGQRVLPDLLPFP